tara:strand:+ start:81 stop:314 length:234 start_codon:yes stop_codon:yes gene_type:complete
MSDTNIAMTLAFDRYLKVESEKAPEPSTAPRLDIQCGDAMSALAASKSSSKFFTNELAKKYGNTNPTYTGEVHCPIL